MKIGTLLTAAIVSLSAVGGGLAVYVAASKYQTMDKVSVAQSRLEVVRAVGEIPRYINPERGFATNILSGRPRWIRRCAPSSTTNIARTPTARATR